MPAKEYTPEEIQKRKQLRKNLRLLALAAACYYFISAGFSFYEDHQAQKIRVVKEIDNVFASQQDFSLVLNNAFKESPLLCENTKDGFTLSSSQTGGKISALLEDGEISALNFEALFDQGLNFADSKLLRAFFKACENTTDEKTVSKIIEVLKLDEKDPAKLIDGMGAGSKYLRYTLTVKDGMIDV
ncbi:MAG: hypothetical protein MR571_05385, partial [Succinatimonas sp.]|nr:hypothetical protein [Succinatimonas sp.]